MKIKNFSIICFAFLLFFGSTTQVKADPCSDLKAAQDWEISECEYADDYAICSAECTNNPALTNCVSTNDLCTNAASAAAAANTSCIDAQQKTALAEKTATGIDCSGTSAATVDATANAGTVTTAQKLPDPLTTGDNHLTALQVVGYALRAMLGMLGAVTLLMFVYGGFMLVWAHGNEEMIKKGQTTILWAVIGMAFVLSSYALLKYLFQLIQGT